MFYDKSFIEVQFPVSKISKESYKERKANLGQTLTGLGKWWGRKPLILVRAIVFGTLMPASNNPKKDMEIFLKVLSMDDDGLLDRKTKNISVKEMHNIATKDEQKKYFDETRTGVKIKKGVNRKELEDKLFKRLTYDQKIGYCIRPEEVKSINKDSMRDINNYFETNATNLQELVHQLSIKRYGRNLIIGDSFAGGGSIPFEVARMGADAFASDLNPIAALLTWASINIIGSSETEIEELREYQTKVYDEVYKQVNKWGIENNEKGWQAGVYLYCNEAICPECGYKVPLLPSLVIGKGTKTIVKLINDDENKRFNFKVIQQADEALYKEALMGGTVVDYNLQCPHCSNATPIPSLRKDKNDGVQRPYRYNTPNSLRKWCKTDFINEDYDIFTERLYCIRYEETIIDSNGNTKIIRHYLEPSVRDLDNENKVIKLLTERINEWQILGYIPDSLIESGWNTNQVIYEKGWTHWNHLFNPRQLLIHGLLAEQSFKIAKNSKEKVVAILGINKCADWNSKLCIWNSGAGVETSQNTFTTQSLNTLFNYGTRSCLKLKDSWFYNINRYNVNIKGSKISLGDARQIKNNCDIWITDPPYADAVNYHELTEFFLSWDKLYLKEIFPQWYVDSKRILAVRGVGEDFTNSMIEVYTNLCKNMPDNGMQVVMFTHSDVKVWAELAMILWSSGLQVTAAWNIATETESGGLKDGNYVKGTVTLILRKLISAETAYLDELYSEIEDEVKNQIDSMRQLDDKEDPNFSDPDYLLAAYAASLKILTSYKNIEDIDVKYELSKARSTSEVSPIENIINQAVKIAYDYLIPSDFDSFIWKSLIPDERLYLKGIELEKQNLYQLSAYQELARGFGVGEYTTMLASTKANTARLKTPKEFAMKHLNDSSAFGNSLLRNILVAIYLGLKEEDASKGRNWLKTEVTDYWNKRSSIIEILNYLSKAEYIDNMEHWKECAHEAFILKNLVENDNI